MPLSPEEDARLRALMAQGMPFTKAAAMLGIAKSRAYYHLHPDEDRDIYGLRHEIEPRQCGPEAGRRGVMNLQRSRATRDRIRCSAEVQVLGRPPSHDGRPSGCYRGGAAAPFSATGEVPDVTSWLSSPTLFASANGSMRLLAEPTAARRKQPEFAQQWEYPLRQWRLRAAA